MVRDREAMGGGWAFGHPGSQETGKGRLANGRMVGPGIVKLKSPRFTAPCFFSAEPGVEIGLELR